MPQGSLQRLAGALRAAAEQKKHTESIARRVHTGVLVWRFVWRFGAYPGNFQRIPHSFHFSTPKNLFTSSVDFLCGEICSAIFVLLLLTPFSGRGVVVDAMESLVLECDSAISSLTGYNPFTRSHELSPYGDFVWNSKRKSAHKSAHKSPHSCEQAYYKSGNAGHPESGFATLYVNIPPKNGFGVWVALSKRGALRLNVSSKRGGGNS